MGRLMSFMRNNSSSPATETERDVPPPPDVSLEMEGGFSRKHLILNWRQLTHGVADRRELPVLLCAHVLAIAGFEGHSLSSPLNVELCVRLSDGRET